MIDNGATAPKTHVLAVGAYDAPIAEEVQPGFLSILDPADAVHRAAGGRQLDRPPHGAGQLAHAAEQSADRARDGEPHLALSFRPRHRRARRAISA